MDITKKKQTHRCREQTSGGQWGEGWGEGKDRGREKRVFMGLYEIMCVKKNQESARKKHGRIPL